MKRRYEVWFLRCGLVDESGAWWFRYLIMNLGRGGIETGALSGMPTQVWATWFPREGEPRSFIQGFPAEKLSLSGRKTIPFHCHIAENGIEEGKCWGNLEVDGHNISWNLRISSHFGFELSNKGWIGFSKSPHSDATFSGEIRFDGKIFAGEPLGFGVQGHNCGHRHRSYWRWMHAYIPGDGNQASTLEALVYDLPLGLTFRNVVLWHEGRATVLRKINEREILKESNRLKWVFIGMASDGLRIEVTIEGVSPGIHRLPYTKTDGSGTFPVANASLAEAIVRITTNGTTQTLKTMGGAVLEMGGI
ncbi:MAG TPA: hypothetical protein VGH37_17525 [Candidatus Acidoferrum sp.]